MFGQWLRIRDVVSICTLALTGVSHAAVATVMYQGSAGEFVTQGQTETIRFDSNEGGVITIAQLFPIDGQSSVLDFNLNRSDGTRVAVRFSSTQLGTPLAVGNYTDAVRNPFPEVLPGFDFAVANRGSNEYRADFTITQLSYDAGGMLSTLEATFDADTGPVPGTIIGSISYASVTAIPEPSGLLLVVGLGGVCFVCRRKRSRLA
ncbi:PEP-CTERM sorting domain-containing protein [Rhodopirellula sp. JC639]|uniref:PEP-CTERM sorting domain-containing protein n=1 Tax=Stieleria mannarensis TaxID=2755585 RepID=UPI0016035F31|nr:PEP-CTERM sorting domain-containing protein [Rhodopirellula sp. JC639]